jgi:hypothetical protein
LPIIVVTEGTRFPSCVRYPALGVGNRLTK